MVNNGYDDDCGPVTKDLEKCECESCNTENLSFGDALNFIRKGVHVTRKYWKNFGNSYIFYQKGYPNGIPCNKQTAEAVGIEEGSLFRCQPYIQMRCFDGSFQMYTPSQNDMLSFDWCLAESEMKSRSKITLEK